MDDNEEVSSANALRHQMAKLVLGTMASFIATGLAELGYDKLISWRKKKPKTEDQ